MERRTWMLLAALALGLGVWHGVNGRWFSAALTLFVLGGVAWWTSPLRGGRQGVTRAEALESGRPVVVYWRPGCPYCERLRRGLGGAGREAAWVDIWRDEEAAAFVRSVNDGNETVPTVVVDGEPHTNPDPSLVRTALTR